MERTVIGHIMGYPIYASDDPALSTSQEVVCGWLDEAVGRMEREAVARELIAETFVWLPTMEGN